MSLDELQAQLRAALDQQFAALKTHYENAITETRQQTRADSERELQATLVAAHAEWEGQLKAQVAAVRAEAERTTAAACARLRAELDSARDEALALAKQAADLELGSERERSGRELEAAKQSAERELENERQRSASDLEAAKQSAAVELEVERQRSGDLETVSRELESERRRIARDLEIERERSRSIMEQAKAAVDAERRRVHTEIEAVRTRLQSEIANAQEAAAREAAAAAAAKAAMAAAEAAAHASAVAAAQTSAEASGRSASVAVYDQLATGIRSLDATNTLGASLDALVACAGAIAGRAALFLVDGDRLKVWKSVPIPDFDVRTVETSIGGSDLLARAIQAGQPTASGPALPPPPFARLPADCPSLAVPLMIAGRAVAALYVDVGVEGAASSAEWNGAVDLLVRHTSALLALRTAMRTFDMLRGVPDQAGGNGDGGDEAARRFARLLVSEIKLYNEGAVRVGRQKRDLSRRLQDEIERARRLYEERVPAGVGARDAYFQQELVQTLADGDASLLGN